MMAPAEILRQITSSDCPFVFRIVDRDETEPGAGTAVLVSDAAGSHGFALTCWHNIDWWFAHENDWRGEVVPLPTTIAVLPRWHHDLQKGGRRVELMGRWSNPVHDIAVLRLRSKVIKEFNLRPAPISFHVRPGAPVIVRGFDRPWLEASLATYRGKIPASMDPFTALRRGRRAFTVRFEEVWQRGLSGGAVFDAEQGALIGVACAVLPDVKGDPAPRSHLEIGYAASMLEVGESWTVVREHCQVVEPRGLARPHRVWIALLLALVVIASYLFQGTLCRFLPRPSALSDIVCPSLSLVVDKQPIFDPEGGPIRTGIMAGRVTGVGFEEHRIVVFAYTDAWYIQPEVSGFMTPIDANGRWTTETHLGQRYAVLLVKSAFGWRYGKTSSLPRSTDVVTTVLLEPPTGTDDRREEEP